jgi:NADPH2 dehydrogenase
MANLLTGLSFSGLRLRNRIVMPPMWSGQATPEGHVTDKIIEYHRIRAASGCGLIIVEHAFVDPRGRNSSTQIGVYSDDMIAGLRRLATSIKQEGAVAALQISHAGSRTAPGALGEQKPVAPSPIRHPMDPAGEIPEALSKEGIGAVVRSFGDAAVRARDAGFDAVEIHGAHGFLLSQFLSPLTNQRSDGYGGCLENRVRIHLETLAHVRQRIGPEFPVFVRLGAHDETAGGLELHDAVAAATGLEAGGASLIDISGGLQGSRGIGRDPGYFVPYAAAIKALVSIPILVTGGIREPGLADRVIREGHADLVGIGRAMLDDADWARKAITALSS